MNKLDRTEFDKIKKMQDAGKDPEIVVKKTGWSRETVRLAYKYATFSAYRRKVVSRVKEQAKRREEAREDARLEKALADFYKVDDGIVLMEEEEHKYELKHSGLFASRTDKAWDLAALIGDELKSVSARAYRGIITRLKETRICTLFYQYLHRSASSLHGLLRRYWPRTSSGSSPAASRPAANTASSRAPIKRRKLAAKSS